MRQDSLSPEARQFLRRKISSKPIEPIATPQDDKSALFLDDSGASTTCSLIGFDQTFSSNKSLGLNETEANIPAIAKKVKIKTIAIE
ncbi:MAG: hypothetical protein JHC69_04450 [Akkermansiaceae bacterium]|nr:hypothetical protein [Akkermansiaceae bacterium]